MVAVQILAMYFLCKYIYMYINVGNLGTVGNIISPVDVLLIIFSASPAQVTLVKVQISEV